jgi:hypothetical protein
LFVSGLVHPTDVVAVLYRHCDDRYLPWLDNLLITSGLVERCPWCAAIAATGQRCIGCGASDDDPPTGPVYDVFAAYGTAPEAVWLIPGKDADPPLRLGVAVVGGGTVGRAYADNGWIYGLWRAGRRLLCGADLLSDAVARTHRQMGVRLAAILAADDLLDPVTRRRLAAWADNADMQPTVSGF